MPRHSQNDEEDIILRYFGPKTDGRILEIGAFNGKDFSNSLALVERGWGGVFVEPSPGPFTGLLQHLGNRPGVQLVQAAIVNPAADDPWVVFHDSGGDALSTLSTAHKVRWELGSGSKFTPFHLLGVTMNQLLKKFGTDFDFINLDVEGTNLDLFHQLPFGAPRLKLICVEHDGHHEEMRAKGRQFGFSQIGFNGENLILGRSQ